MNVNFETNLGDHVTSEGVLQAGFDVVRGDPRVRRVRHEGQDLRVAVVKPVAQHHTWWIQMVFIS